MFTYDWIHSRYDSLIHIMGKNVLDTELKDFVDISRSPRTAW
ncbi:MAG: hypothetical protein ACLTMP_08820 [Eggerthella lenta]